MGDVAIYLDLYTMILTMYRSLSILHLLKPNRHINKNMQITEGFGLSFIYLSLALGIRPCKIKRGFLSRGRNFVYSSAYIHIESQLKNKEL